ncbi:MAG: sporulation protein [Saprospiraceae bacterium]|nr:sporulation protein [Candidatus Opimibacter iunctus]
MFGKVKRWLGIEGVKIEMILPDQVSASSGVIEGKLKFESMHVQTVTKIRITLTEKYIRGRWKSRLTDQYKIGEIELDEPIEVPAHEVIMMDFELPFTFVKSDMDEIADKNFVFRKLVDAAKTLKNVKSEFYIEAEAEVNGTALSPFDKQEIKIV